MYHRPAQKFLAALLQHMEQRGERASHAEFYARLGAHFSDIYQLFYRLYGGREDVSERLSQLVRLLVRAHNERPEELKQIDRTRVADPQWYLSSSLVSTMLYVDRFSGTLAGFEKRIDYLKELGINLIHLMPLLECPKGKNDGGYAVSNYRKVDEAFGSMEDLEGVISALHKNGMLLQLDLVLNHTSDQHEWAQAARAGDAHFQEYYYLFDDRSVPDEYERSLPEVFPENAPGNFTFMEELGKWVMTVFHEYQWDLNYTNPHVFLEMLDILLFLANRGVDVLRLDAVPYLWKRIGSNSQNEPEAHLILQLFNSCAKVVAPGVAFMAEAVVQPAEIVRYFGEGDYAGRECEMAYHVSLMVLLWDCIATGDTRLFMHAMQTMPEIPREATWFTYIRCHDDIGLGYADKDILSAGFDPFLHRRFMVEYFTGEYPGSPARGATFMYNPRTQDARISGTAASLLGLERAVELQDQSAISAGIDSLIMLYAIVTSIGGIPIIYYGDEVGITNDYTFLTDPVLHDDNRWMHRPRIDWDRMERRHKEGSVEQRVFTRMQRLIAVRKATPEFGAVNPMHLVDAENSHILAFLRHDESQRTFVMANVTDLPQYIDRTVLGRAGLPEDAVDLITGEPPLWRAGKILFDPYQFYWLSTRRIN